jgi:nitrate reductase NapE component
MAQEGQTMVVEPRAPSSNPVPDAQALIEEARRRHRKRRLWIAAMFLAVVVFGLLITAAVGGFNGNASTRPSAPLSDAAAPSAPPGGSLSSPSSPGVVGAGATSIDFLDADHGWIATGCGYSCTTANPIMVRTDDGGSTWRRMRVPNMTATTISPSVWHQYGGVVEVRFVTSTNGWYLQAGELWTTSNGGTTWRLVHLGVVRAFTMSGDNAWALVDDCPDSTSLTSCGRLHVWYRTSQAGTWRRIPRALSTGSGIEAGALLVADHGGAVVGTPGGLFSATQQGTLVAADPTCTPVGTLSPGRLLGLCGMGGGGDASVVSFDVSTDAGRHWRPLAGGPPSHAFSGATATNDAGVLFYVTGGTTLWRLDTAGTTWTPVLQTTPNTTDEIYPITFADPDHGLAFESGSSGVHLFATHDAGLTWSPMPVP